jgi:TRAP-type C4-dicarboxylate transport system permease small subunit
MVQDDGRLMADQTLAAGYDPDAPRPSEEVERLGDDQDLELLPERQPWRSIMHVIGVIEQAAAAILLVIILVLVLAQVGSRYVPGTWVWTGEVARLSLVWLTFVIAGYIAAFDRHIAIHTVDWVLSGRPLAAVKLFANAAVVVTCVAMMYAVYQLVATDIGGVTPAAELPLAVVNAVPFIGFALVALRSVMRIVLVDIPALHNRAETAS